MSSQKPTNGKPGIPNQKDKQSQSVPQRTLNSNQKKSLMDIIVLFGPKQGGEYPNASEVLKKVNSKGFRRIFKEKIDTERKFEQFVQKYISNKRQWLQNQQLFKEVDISSFKEGERRLVVVAKNAILNAVGTFAHEKNVQVKPKAEKQITPALAKATKNKGIPEAPALSSSDYAIKAATSTKSSTAFSMNKRMLDATFKAQEGDTPERQIQDFVNKYSDFEKKYREIRKSHGGWKQWAPEKSDRKRQIIRIGEKLKNLKADPSKETLASLRNELKEILNTTEQEKKFYRTGDKAGKGVSALGELCSTMIAEISQLEQKSTLRRKPV